MKDLWFSRDAPILERVVQHFEDNDRPLLNLGELAEASGFSISEVGKAAQNLDKAGYIELVKLMSGSDYAPWFIKAVNASALYAVGAWPTPESVAKAMVDELQILANREDGSEVQGWLKKLMTGAGDISKEVFTRVVTEVAVRVLSPGK